MVASLFLVPVVLLAAPGAAVAAGGEWSQIQIDMSVLGSQDWVGRDCTFNARNTGASVEVGSAGYCTGLPDASPGGVQPGEAGSSFVLTFDGADASSGSCGATYGGTLGQHPMNGTMRVAGSIPAGSAAITGGAGDGTCVVTQVCVRLMGTEFVCVAAALEPPDDQPDPGGACMAGTPHVSARWVNSGPWDGDPSGEYRVWLYMATVTRAGNAVSTAQWGLSAHSGGPVGSGGFTADITSTSEVQIGGRIDYRTPTDKMVGVEVYAVTPGGWNTPVPDIRSQNVGPSVPRDASAAYMGWTQPEHCRFWFGDKIVNDSSTDADDPAGTGIDPYVEPPDPVEPPIEEPTPVVDPFEMPDFSWLWAILDAVRRAIVAVKDAILGIASAIVEGIKGLFVPDDDFFDRKVASVDDAMEGSTVDNYVQVFDGLAPAGASGCTGPSVTVPFGPGTFTPLNACDGVMAQAAAISKVVIGVGFAVTAFFAVLRILGSGFGWNPTPSGGVQ